jgi:ketosteroid isomerase-like protein
MQSCTSYYSVSKRNGKKVCVGEGGRDAKTDIFTLYRITTMTLTKEQKAEVKETLGRYCAAYQRKDLKALLALFSPAISGYGAGQDEVFKNRKEYAPLLKRDLMQAISISLAFTDVNISGDGQAAWVMSGCNCMFVAEGKDKQTMRVRMTLGLRNTGSRWLIEQLHLSVPNAGQAPGQSFSGE